MSHLQNEEDANREGYYNLKTFADGEQAVLFKFLFTIGIIYGLTPESYENRWCYANEAAAKKALDEWDGTGEPVGWHRHPDTGRRIDEQGNMYVAR
jgi:hypothetical protein